jgi:uncharacterized protein (DUF433 family)
VLRDGEGKGTVMEIVTSYQYIVKTTGVCGGKPRISGHRIRVQDIASDYDHLGLSPDDICDAHPGLNLAQVHAALAYYFDHRDEIATEIEADRKFAESFQQQHPDSVR